MAQRVAVTGASGKLGRAAVKELLAHGWEVMALDTVQPAEPLCPFIRVDLTDFGQTVEALTAVDDRHAGVDAVVHLAAIPGPGMAPNATTFANNTLCAYNVFSAARMAGVRNLVWASSETLLGIPFETPPPYLPVDEEYPARPETAYSLAKSVEEHIAAQFCRWEPEMKMIGLRFSNVMEESDYSRFPGFQAEPELRKWNLWSYIDARDGAQAIRLALGHEATGMEVFVIASPDTVMETPTKELAARVFPGVEVRRPLPGHQSLLSSDKARRVLGYAPTYSWRDYVPTTEES
jgi:nucleoside-diphosphate-sugar epimerase